MKSQITFCLLVLASLLPNWLSAQDQLKIKDSNGNVLFEAREDGVLIRKMTTADRTAVAPLDSTDNGLMVYDTDTKSLWLWLDNAWKEIDGVDLVNDADSDPTNELQSWLTLPGIPTGFADGTDDVNDADSDPTNELQTWATLPGVPAGFIDGTDDVNDADSDPTNELDTWSTLPGKPAGFADGTDDVNDADSDPTNELQSWSTLPGKPAGFEDGTDDVNDADSDPTNEINTSLTRTGTQISLTDSGGSLSAEIGWAISPGKVFNQADQIGIGIAAPASKFHVENGTVLFNGSTGATPIAGAGTRMMWIPAKAAFRSGTIGGTQWDDANIGLRSFVAGGLTNIASGINAFTGGGFLNTASGVRTFIASGQGNTASNENAFAAGLDNVASGVTSFVSGRQSVASGTQAFAAGYGLTAKSFGETVFGSYNSDYTPVSTTGFDNTDQLFVIGNGTSNAARSNAMTILKDGKVGIGAEIPSSKLHVKGSAAAGQHVMVIENTNHEGSGLRIKIDGSHPLFVTGAGGDPDFFVTHPGSAIVDVFEPLANDVRNYLLTNGSLDVSNIDFATIASPGGFLDQLGLVDLVSGGVCKGASTLVDMINGIGLESITLPNLPLDAIPVDIPNIPNMPPIPTVPNFTIVTPAITIDPPVIGVFTFNPPNITLNTDPINDALAPFNTAITSVNSGIGNVNNTLENGYDNLRSGLNTLDNLEIPLPQLQVPTQIGPITCPNPNPWDNFSFSFEQLNPADYNIVNPLTTANSFITFSDQYDNKLGAITAQGLGEFSQDYFKTEKVLEIAGNITGMFSDDGNVTENLTKLGKEAIAYYKAVDKIGVLYESGHGDYAEWLERENHNEQIGYGDIIGIKGGKISLSLDDAEQVMVVSKAPIVLGNIPQPGKERNGNNVAFIGQVPVKVMGPVHTGDYIIANPLTPGYGVAVNPDDITSEQLAIAVGRSWEANANPGFKFVNTIVGMHNNGWSGPMIKLQQQLDEQQSAIQSLSDRLDNLEMISSVASSKRDRH